MLLEFKVGNYRSFKDIVTFSMIAAPITEHNESHVFSFGKYQLLKSAVIYGANASGKSNLFKALDFMKLLVVHSSKNLQYAEAIHSNRFRLSTETEDKPSFFEITFICDNKRYRYGFEVDEDKVCAEWLFFTPSRQEAKLFTRDKDDFSIGRYFKEGKGLAQKTRPNALFLSVVAQFNGEIAAQIVQWFSRSMVLLDVTNIEKSYTLRQIDNPDFKKSILQFLQLADVGIYDIDVDKQAKLTRYIDRRPELPSEFIAKLKPALEEMQPMLESLQVNMSAASTFHEKYDLNNQPVSVEQFDFEHHESLGTQRFLHLLGPIFGALNFGPFLVIDELDTRLHPLLTQLIVRLFHASHNHRNVQLIFATHDTNLLSKELFRRDQIWFAEKDMYGATDLYSLVEYKPTGKTIRKDASFEKNYILGRYGAIPFIGGIENLLTS